MTVQEPAKGIILPSVLSEAFKPLTYQIPVGMLPIVNKPIMEHHIEMFVRNAIKKIHISCNHLSNKVEAYFDKGSRWGASITYNFERPPFGFIAALRQMRPYFTGESLVVINADVLADIDLQAALEFHWSRRSDVTFICMPESEDAKGLSLSLDDHSRLHAVGAHGISLHHQQYVDTGICIIEPGVLDLLSDTFGYNLLQVCWLASQSIKLNLFGYAVNGPVTRVTDWRSYVDVQRQILDGKYPGIIIPGIQLQPGVWVGKNLSVSSHVSFESPLVIGDDCRIGKGVRLGKETIIGHEVMVDVGARLERATVLSKTFVGPQTVIQDSIIQGNLMIDMQKDSFVAIEDKLTALEIEHPSAGYAFYLFFNRVAAVMLALLLSPFLAILFLLMIVGLKFPLVTRVRRIAPDLHELSAGKLRLRVFDLLYLGPADLTQQPVGYVSDPLTTLPHAIARIGNLANVIAGDILLVGNRPMDPEVAFAITEEYRRTRLKCQGGVISILDTNEADEGTEEEQIISEGYYAVNRNLWMDVSVLVRGVWRLFWRLIGTRKVVREYRPIPPEESPSFE